VGWLDARSGPGMTSGVESNADGEELKHEAQVKKNEPI